MHGAATRRVVQNWTARDPWLRDTRRALLRNFLLAAPIAARSERMRTKSWSSNGPSTCAPCRANAKIVEGQGNECGRRRVGRRKHLLVHAPALGPALFAPVRDGSPAAHVNSRVSRGRRSSGATG